MQGSTVVISPPDGDMSAYLASLRALLPVALDWLAPGHGFLMAHPHRAIEGIIAHRLRREAKVLERLSGLLQLGGGPDLLQVQLMALALVLVQNLIYVLALHAVAYWIFPRLQSPISEPPALLRPLLALDPL